MAQDNNSVLDTELFGFYIRRMRTEAGYQKAEDFAEALTERVGYPVSRQTIYNIESGKQEPKLSLYLAMMRLLRPEKILTVDQAVVDSLPARWRIPLAEIEKHAEDSADENAIVAFADVYSNLSNAILDVQGGQLRETMDRLTDSMRQITLAATSPGVSETIARLKEITGAMLMETAPSPLPLSQDDDEEDTTDQPASVVNPAIC